MAKTMRKNGLDWLRSRASSVGLSLSTWKPGDGMTRYRFETADGSREVSRTLMGFVAAEIWLDAYEAGREAVMQDEEALVQSVAVKLHEKARRESPELYDDRWNVEWLEFESKVRSIEVED